METRLDGETPSVPMHLATVAALLLVALPVHAVDPSPGDLFMVDPTSAYHIDADTGDRTVISCWGPTLG